MSHLSIDKIVEAIRARGSMRTPELAQAFDASEAAIEHALWPLCGIGQALISCAVEVDGKRMKEYRASTIGGGELKDVFTVAPGRPRKAVLHKPHSAFGTDPKAITEALGARFQKPAAPPVNHVPPTAANAPKPTTPRKEVTAPMTTAERILSAIEKRGPMDTPTLRSLIDAEHIATTCSQLARKKKLVKLGGGPKTTIYGLPGQKAPAGAAATPKPEAARKSRMKPAKTRRLAAPRLSGVTIALAEDRLRTLLACALNGGAFILTTTETRELAAAAYLPGRQA